jgi:hypothetical protein
LPYTSSSTNAAEEKKDRHGAVLKSDYKTSSIFQRFDKAAFRNKDKIAVALARKFKTVK